MNNLRNISPIDGRYASKTKVLQDYFSEFSLIKYRVKVEIEYLIALSNLKELNFFLTKNQTEELRKIYIDFEECIVKINKKIDEIFFKKKFYYASKFFVVIEPHLVAFNLFTKAIIIDKIISRKVSSKILVEIYDEELSKDFYHRFINLYELIARKIGHPFQIVNKGKANIYYKNDPSSKLKLLNLFNFNYKILAYEILKKTLNFSFLLVLHFFL